MEIIDLLPEKTMEQQLSNFEEIKLSPITATQSLGELLEQKTSVNIINYGDRFGYTTISIRGSSSSQVGIYYNNFPLDLGSQGDIDLSLFPLIGVTKIEVIRGADFINSGTNMPGGVINLITTPEKKKKNLITFGLGSWISNNIDPDKLYSFSALRTVGFWHESGLNPGINFSIGSLWEQSLGDYYFLFDNGTFRQTNDDIFTYRENNQANRMSLFSAINIKGWNNHSISLNQRSYIIERGVPGFASIQTQYTHLNVVDTLWQFQIKNNMPITKSYIMWNLGVQFNYNREDFDDRYGEIGIGLRNYVNNTVKGTFSGTLKWLKPPLWGRLTLSENYIVWNPKDKLHPDLLLWNWSRNSATANLLLGIMLNEHLNIISQIGTDLLNDSILGNTDKSQSYSTPPESMSGIYSTPQIGIIYNPLKPLTLKSNFIWQQRYPSLIEIFGNQGTIIPSPDLEAEQGWTLESSFVLKGDNTSWFNNPSLEGTIFYRNIDNLIQFSQTSQYLLKAQNIGDTNFFGVEIKGMINLKKLVSLSLSYSWIRSKILSNISYLNNKSIPMSPEHCLDFSLSFNFWKIELLYQLDFKSSFYLDFYNSYPVPYHLRHNAEIKLHLTKPQDFLFSLRFENITDELSEDVFIDGIGDIRRPVIERNGYPLSGRIVYFTFIWNI